MDPVFSQAQLAYSQVLYWAVSKNVILEQPDGSWAPCPDCLSQYFRQAWGHWLVPIAGQWSHPVKPPTADLEDLAKVAIMLGADEVWQNSPSTNILQ